MKIKQLIADNNLRTTFVQYPESKSSTLQFWFRAGSSLETKEDYGLAHFLEHMFFKGTKKRPGSKLTKAIENLGGEVNAFTSFDYTCYYINCPQNTTLKCLEILLDMVANPEFPSVDIPAEREVVHEEYKRSIDGPSSYLFHQIQKNSFMGSYAHPILGSPKTILKFTKRQLQKFRNNFYNTSNAMLIIGGDIPNLRPYLKSINSFKFPNGPISEYKKFKLRSKNSINLHKKDVKMLVVSIVYESLSHQDTNLPAEIIAINCFGHGESSTMYNDLIEKNAYANSFGASNLQFNNGGILTIRIGLPIENLEDCVKCFSQSLEKLIENGFDEETLQKIKNQYIASKVYEQESIEQFTFSLGHSFAQAEDIYSENAFIEQISTLSINEVNKAFRNIFSRPFHLNIQVPDQVKEITNKHPQITYLEKNLTRIQKELSKDKKSPAKKNLNTSKHDKNVHLLELRPGIKLLYKQNAITPTFCLHQYIMGGLCFENSDNNGIHYLISQLLGKSHPTLDSYNLSKRLDFLSSSIGGFTGKNTYGLTLHGQTKDIKELIDLFLSMALKPEFRENDFKNELEFQRRQLEAHEKDPIKMCFKNFNQHQFPGHSFGMNIHGELDSIKNFQLKQITKYHQENLHTNPMIFSFVGSAPIELVQETLRSALKDFSSRKNKTIEKTPSFKKNSTNSLYIPFQREQAHFFYGKRIGGINTLENTYLKILTQYLSGQSSELFVEVRDKQGLCYSVLPIHSSGLQLGFWGIYMAQGPEKTEASFKAIKTLLQKIGKKGFSKSQLEQVKKTINSKSLMGLQTNEDFASAYSVFELYQLGFDYYYKSIEKINKVQLNAFNLFLKKFLNDDFISVICGPERPAF